jgi:hypothetical protein
MIQGAGLITNTGLTEERVDYNSVGKECIYKINSFLVIKI